MFITIHFVFILIIHKIIIGNFISVFHYLILSSFSLFLLFYVYSCSLCYCFCQCTRTLQTINSNNSLIIRLCSFLVLPTGLNALVKSFLPSISRRLAHFCSFECLKYFECFKYTITFTASHHINLSFIIFIIVCFVLCIRFVFIHN